MSSLPDTLESRRFFVGLDLGHQQDHSALAVIEHSIWQTGDRSPYDYSRTREIRNIVRFLHRFPLHTPYPDIVARTGNIVRGAPLYDNCSLIVDATGVGLPIVELLRASSLPCTIIPVTITCGDQPRHSRLWWYVPKRDLVTGLILMLEQRRLVIASRLPSARAFSAELKSLRQHALQTGYVTFDTPHNQHDDLVFAVALAAWRARTAL